MGLIPAPAHIWEEWHAKGYCHQLLGEWEQAVQCYEQALECKPDYAFSQHALAQLRMMQSRFRDGRELYEWRFAAREDAHEMDWRNLPIPRWRGENITGKHLHVWVEQGFGDVVMYAGFLPYLLAQKPARITLSMFPKMMSLFARSFPDIVVESLQDIGKHTVSAALLDTFPQLLALAQSSGAVIDLEPMRRDYEQAKKRGKPDYSAPMGDLLVYGLPGYIPAQNASYLRADPQRMAEARAQMQALGAGRRVGISWHTPEVKSGFARNVPLAQWLPVLNVPGCHFISLQHHVLAGEIERFCEENNCRIIVDPKFDAVQDTEGLAALAACMDEIITIDNSNAHLAGALGVPTTLLLPKGCDFRWPILEDETDTLWYKSVHAERQKKAGEWQPVIERVAVGLRGRAQ